MDRLTYKRKITSNPPYMGTSNMDDKLRNHIKANYATGRYDLFAVFIECLSKRITDCGYCAMITQQTWMFQSGYEDFRMRIKNHYISSLLHLGPRAFDEISGEVVQSVAFVLSGRAINQYKGVFCRLVEGNSELEKRDLFFNKQWRYTTSQSVFNNLPGHVIAYWINNDVSELFCKNSALSSYVRSSYGLLTGDNESYLRVWFEVNFQGIKFDGKFNNIGKWAPCNMGGSYRKWYSEPDDVVLWENDGKKIKESKKAAIPDATFIFQESIAWNDISTSTFSIRYISEGVIGGHTCPAIFTDKRKMLYFLALLASKVASYFFAFLSPTLHNNTGDILKIPVIFDHEETVYKLSSMNVELSQVDYHSFETSWDFQHHPLLQDLRDATSVSCAMKKFYGYLPKSSCPLETEFLLWQGQCNHRFNQLKSNEEELNRIFIDIYGLQEELIPEVADKDVTVRKADLQRDIKSLISYAVGCMLGRYSLDKPGLAFAGGDWNDYIASEEGRKASKTYAPDVDGVLPITDDEYFGDDIVTMFVNFIRTAYGADTLEANLKYIADALGGTGSARDVIRNYFLNDFFADHCSTYSVTGSGKRPIYWLFDSGKKNGFKCLIYMHRYQPDTIARIRTDYIHELQSRYRTAITDLSERVDNAAGSERVKLNKQLTKIKDQELELQKYEEKIHHLADQMISIDLDDGVKVNYGKFENVLAKIK